MNYFKVLGIGFGLIAFLKPFYMHLLPAGFFGLAMIVLSILFL